MSLSNKRILVTRQKEQAAEFVSEIEGQGGRAIVVPMINIVDPDSWAECDQALVRIEEYHGLLFTSANGAEKFFSRCETMGVALSRLSGLDVYTVGTRTKKEVEERGVRVRFLPEQYSSASLAEYFKGMDLGGRRFLHPTGNLGKRDLDESLRQLGIIIDVIQVYRNEAPNVADANSILDLLKGKGLEVVTFASPSAAENFSKIVPADVWVDHFYYTKIAVIGPTTREAVVSLGYPADIVARESTVRGLVDAISAYYENAKS
ncbi:MAG: uroporphyrinogen-III synthase [Ignavibacteriae bacterium]|nr:uroporphyrinogen-III synthase [Ignavibacteriota bacterium]